ncbi:hypothetical protein ERD95_21960 [Enterobacteriaceae bacterium ML5]|nr:hypothetical protein ERD95_21960 [Enterobacteriaceae bacterium ML5]
MDTKAAFEKWLKEKMPTTYRYVFEVQEEDDEEMINHFKASVLDMRTAWEGAWQASRAAIEIDISPENVEALVTTCQHLIDREGYSEHSANLRLIAKLALPMLTSHGIRIKGKTE